MYISFHKKIGPSGQMVPDMFIYVIVGFKKLMWTEEDMHNIEIELLSS